MSAYSTSVTTDSPLSYVRLDETSGVNAADQQGGAAGVYTGSVLLGRPSVVPTDTDLALGLTGRGYVSFADRAAFDVGDVFTLECWINPTSYRDLSNAPGAFIDKGANGYIVRFADALDGRFILRKNGVSTLVTSTVAVPLNQPSHIVVTKNGSSVHLYLNGQDVTGTVTNTTIGNVSTPLTIGVADAGADSFFIGTIDEVAIYGVALSAARVLAHYQAGVISPLQSAAAVVTPQTVPLPPATSAHNPFTYPAWDLTSMTELDSLPYYGVQFGRVVNQPGSWSGSLLLTDPRVQNAAFANSSRPGRTLLCVDLGGVIVWGGIIWTRRYDSQTKVMQVGASEVGSYFQRRLQAADYTSTWAARGADPMRIAEQVVSDAQAVSGGSIAGGITLVLNPAGGSGQTVAVSYPGTQLQTVDQIVSTLAQMGYTFGFDYSFDVAYLPGTKTPGVTLNFWYPRQGQTADLTGIVVLAKDTMRWSYDEDASKQANNIWESGSGNGNIAPIEATASTPGYPLLEDTFSRTDVNTEPILANVAIADLGNVCYPVVTPQVVLPVPLPTDPDRAAHLGLGDFNLGDDMLFRVDPVAGGGENIDPRFPAGMSFEWRITNWTCTVPERGKATLQFDLTNPPVFTIPPPQPPL